MGLILAKRVQEQLHQNTQGMNQSDLMNCFENREAIFVEGKEPAEKRTYWFMAQTANSRIKVAFAYSENGHHMVRGINELSDAEEAMFDLEAVDGTARALELAEQFFSLSEHCSQMLSKVAGQENDRHINRDLTLALSCTNAMFCKVHQISDAPVIRQHVAVRLACLDKLEQDAREPYVPYLRRS